MLSVVMYHYVRDLAASPFPGLKALDLAVFQAQVEALARQYEMANLESALAFLRGDYVPARPQCLLTFDDGLKEHLTVVAPILARLGIAGLFFIPTQAPDGQRVFGVHKNQFLLAALGIAQYRQRCLELLAQLTPEPLPTVDQERAAATYRWDTPQVAAFKYLLNFALPASLRDQVIDRLFAETLGDEAEFARGLYLDWNEVQALQDLGMIVGGHTHTHQALASLDDQARGRELATCQCLLAEHLRPQDLWPFCYPWGKAHTFNDQSIAQLAGLGYACSFTSEAGVNLTGQDPFRILRQDAASLVVSAI
jgi:peptidoglycan/xylan/chitin deacetylase (PgdA/CDA1 family)